MTDVQKSDRRDQKVVALRQSATSLTCAADGGPDIPCAKPECSKPRAIGLLSQSLKNAKPSLNCKQKLWFSFFFDGTGNNLDADIGSKEHTSVARLYRAHRGNAFYGKRVQKADAAESAIYRIYVPGVGTYFSEVGDVGGTDRGLGIGEDGQGRLDWALKQFTVLMKKPLADAANPANAIAEVNIAVFGFSRGAAAARAFVYDFVNDYCVKAGDALQLKEGKCPVRIRFVGLFDTVASVGPGVSYNTINTSELKAPLDVKIKTRFREFPLTAPKHLAFALKGKAGADPAPGMRFPRQTGHPFHGKLDT